MTSVRSNIRSSGLDSWCLDLRHRSVLTLSESEELGLNEESVTDRPTEPGTIPPAVQSCLGVHEGLPRTQILSHGARQHSFTVWWKEINDIQEKFL